jgi:hypothetical protein
MVGKSYATEGRCHDRLQKSSVGQLRCSVYLNWDPSKTVVCIAAHRDYALICAVGDLEQPAKHPFVGDSFTSSRDRKFHPFYFL